MSIFGVCGNGGWRTWFAVLGVLRSRSSLRGRAGARQRLRPGRRPDSMYNLTAQMGAQAWWNAGYTGNGVDVAVIDTGVSPVQGLDAPGKVVYGPDLSLESQAPNLPNLDTNGHGTFMAGLIAGHDAALTAPYCERPGLGLPGHGAGRPHRLAQGRRPPTAASTSPR